MEVVSEPTSLQEICDRVRQAGRRVGLVPTMGALHEGHLQLVDEARRHAECVVVTVFVNPTQFGPNEDLLRYPRALDSDLAACRARGVDVVFTPEASRMYPAGEATRVSVERLSRYLCGASRPGHFQGVCTVVSKLFALAGRSTAVFGRKDYQQWKIIERMTRDLFLPVTIVSLPTVREPDGLALSSRNLLLSGEQRASALGLVRGLRAAQTAFGDGLRDANELVRLACDQVLSHSLLPDYVTVADPEELTPLEGTVGERALLAVAAFADGVRLIDNVVLGEVSSSREAP